MILWSLQSHKKNHVGPPKKTPRHCLWDNFPLQPSWSRLYFRKKPKGNFSGGLGWTVMELFWVLTTHDLFEESAAHQKHREICFIHQDEEKQTHFLHILLTRCLMWRPNKKSLAEYEPTFRWPTEFAEDFQHASKLKNNVFLQESPGIVDTVLPSHTDIQDTNLEEIKFDETLASVGTESGRTTPPKLSRLVFTGPSTQVPSLKLTY